MDNIKQKDGFKGERILVLPQSIIREMENNPLSSILHITDIGYYPHAQHHYRERQEPINQYVFIYCIKGEGWFQLNGQTYTVTENQYFILPASRPHTYGTSEKYPWTIYWIHFKGKLASCFLPNTTAPIDIKPNQKSRINYRIDMFEEIFHTLEMGFSHNNLLYACSIFYHYLGTLQYLQQYRNAIHKDVSSQEDVITASIHFMKENIEKKLTLQSLAHHIGYSVPYYSVLFKQCTRHTPIAYFNQLKIQYACRLLDSTNMKINQVCFKLGIEDPYYFSRLFSKIMGISPHEYKKMKKG